MLKDEDRIFTNLYGMHDRSLRGAQSRGHWSETAKIIKNGQEVAVVEIITDDRKNDNFWGEGERL